MISDTLSDAAYEIRAYLSEMPEVYRPVKGQIQALLVHMDKVREILDSPPSKPTPSANKAACGIA